MSEKPTKSEATAVAFRNAHDHADREERLDLAAARRAIAKIRDPEPDQSFKAGRRSLDLDW